MATSLESLIIELKAKSDDFNVKFSQVEARLASFERTTKASTARVESAFGGLTAIAGRVNAAFAAISTVAALGGLTALTKGALDAADSLSDMAQRLGIGVEALQEWQFAAVQSGSSADQFNTALEQFNRRLGEAASGTGEAAKVIKALGLDIKALAADPAKALDTIADKISAIENPTQRAQIVFDLFGRSGGTMITVLGQGSEALADLRREARDTGAVMAESVVKQGAELNDKFAAAADAIDKQFKSALIGLAPTLTKVVQDLAPLASKVNEILQTILQANTIGKKGRLQEISEELHGLSLTLADLEQKQRAGGEGFLDRFFGGALIQEPLETRTAKIRQQMQELTGEFNKIEGEIVDLGTTSTTSGQKIDEELAGALGKTSTEADKAAKKIAEVNEAAREQAASFQLQTSLLRQVLAGTLSHAEAEERFAIATERAKGVTEANAVALVHAKTANEQVSKAVDEHTASIKERTEELQKHLDQQLEITRSIEDEIALNTTLTGIYDQVSSGALSYADAQHQIAIETTKAQLVSQKFAGDVDKQAEALVNAREAFDKAREGAENYSDSLRDALVTTNDLKDVGADFLNDLFDGRLSGRAFKEKGKEIGKELIHGIFFGKSNEEHLIIGNFNELVGIDKGGGIIGAIFKTGGAFAGQSFVESFGAEAFGKGVGFADTMQRDVDASQVDWQIAGGTSGKSWGQGFLAAIGGTMTGMALGSGFNSLIGLDSKEAKLGGTIGGSLGGIGGGIAGFIFGGPIGAAIGSAAGSFLGEIIGGFLGSLFEHIPTKGTQIRTGVKAYLKEIEVSFAKEIDSSDYFFEETKKLADKMFGGDFLAASKQILTDTAGPEIAKQLQALGTFLTADHAIKLGKSVEQTGTTFGNMLVDNLGIDAIPDAIDEIIQKGGIDFESLATKLNEVFEQGKIGVDFYTGAISGAVDIFYGDLPASINVSRIALESFTDDGIFSVSEFNSRLEEATSLWNGFAQAATAALTSVKSDLEALADFDLDLNKVFDAVLTNTYINEKFLPGLEALIDVSDGVDAEEIAKVKQFITDSRIELHGMREEAGLLTPALNDVAVAAEGIAVAFGTITIDAPRIVRDAQEAAKKAAPTFTRYLFGGEIRTVGNRAGNDLGEQYAEGFRNSLAESIPAAIQDAIVDAVINQAILAPFFAWLTEYTKGAMADGVLSPDEIATIINAGRTAATSAGEAAEKLQPLFDDMEIGSDAIKNNFEVGADAFKGIDLNPIVAQSKEIADNFNSIKIPTVPTTDTVGLAGGGFVPGSGSGDTVPAMLTPGEYVLTKQQTRSLLPALLAMERDQRVQHFAFGGAVGQGFGSASGLRFGRIGNTPFGSSRENAGGGGGFLTPEDRQLLNDILGRVRDFIGEIADPTAAVREQFRSLTEELNKNRRALERAGHDVDGLLTQLSTSLPERLREAVEQSISGLIGARDALRDSISSLLTGSDSPLSAFEKTAFLQSQQAALEAKIGTASTQDLPGILQDLAANVQQQLAISPFDLSERGFLEQFNRTVAKLEGLQHIAQGRIDQAYTAAGITPTGQPIQQTNTQTVNVNVTFSGNAGSAEDRASLKKELREELVFGESGKIIRKWMER